MDEKLKRALFYIGTRLAVVLLVIVLATGAFYSSMKTSNVYFVLNDALKARLDVIILGTDINEKSKFFSYNYLQTAEYSQLQEKYGLYIINNYGHKLEYDNLFVWPWQTSKTVTVKEAVFAINGELDTTQMSKADAMAFGLYNVPDWDNSVYRVKLVFENGSWLIDSVVRRGDFDYKPPQTPSLSEEEIDALRTPAPTPEPTGDGQTQGDNKQTATIGNLKIGDTANLREGPATEYNILAELKSGDVVSVIKESDGWYLVETKDGISGYVNKYYIVFN